MMDAEHLVSWLRQMGHDMRVPLSTLISTSDMLAKGIYDPLTPKQTRAVERLQRNQQRLLTMLDDFVTLVKAEARQIELLPVEIDTGAQIEAWRKLVETAITAKGLALRVEQTAAVPKSVKVDAALLNRVVMALLWNAVAFTETGSIALTSDWTKESRWSITVQDTGGGFAAEQIAHAFEPFWRGGDDPQVPTARAGLGLPLARALAELMGGTVELVVTSPNGTTVRAQIPAEYPPTD